jgi:hypothetical protein
MLKISVIDRKSKPYHCSTRITLTGQDSGNQKTEHERVVFRMLAMKHRTIICSLPGLLLCLPAAAQLPTEDAQNEFKIARFAMQQKEYGEAEEHYLHAHKLLQRIARSGTATTVLRGLRRSSICGDAAGG